MKDTIDQFERTRVLVVGDVMLDRYWFGDAFRVSPEAPVPVVNVTAQDERAGGAANVAMNLVDLGCKVTLVGFRGEDEAGDQLEALLTSAGVATRLLIDTASPTITKLRVVSRNQQLLRMDFECAFSGNGTAELEESVISLLDAADVLVLSDYAKGTLAAPKRLIEQAADRSIPVVVDPKRNDFSAYCGATVITPNTTELAAVLDGWDDDSQLRDKATRMLSECNIDNLLLTRSEKGMSLIQANGGKVDVPARAREVFDVTGAGDTVVATLAAALGAGADVQAASRLANAAAGLVVGKLGTASVTASELGLQINDESLSHGLVDENQLGEIVQRMRRDGKRIVMTNGCFDLLHPGHVEYLREAADLGEVLIVAVNDDESVRRLKGEGRPINTLSTRMKMLAALSTVDYVVAFSEDTPERLIAEILPDVLVKGGDYQVEQIAGHRQVLDAGGEVKIINFVEGYSSTQLIRQIRDD